MKKIYIDETEKYEIDVIYSIFNPDIIKNITHEQWNTIYNLIFIQKEEIEINEKINKIIFDYNKEFKNKKLKLNISDEIENTIRLKVLSEYLGIISTYSENKNHLLKKEEELKNLNSSEFNLLKCLYKKNGLVLHKDLANELNYSSAMVTKLMKNDEIKNNVRIRKINQRKVYYCLTSKCKEIMNNILENRIGFKKEEKYIYDFERKEDYRKKLITKYKTSY